MASKKLFKMGEILFVAAVLAGIVLGQATPEAHSPFRATPVTTGRPQTAMYNNFPILIQPGRYSTIGYNRPFVQNAHSMINSAYYPQYQQLLRGIPLQPVETRPVAGFAKSSANLKPTTPLDPRFFLFPWTWGDNDYEGQMKADESEIHFHEHVFVNGQYAILDDGFVYYYDHNWSRSEKQEPEFKSLEAPPVPIPGPGSTLAPLITKTEASPVEPN